jgi:hypothetical protein
MNGNGNENPAERLVTGLGGRTAVRIKFGLKSNETVRLWLKHGIPAERALEVEEVTRGTDYAITATQVLEYAKQQRAAA